VLKTDHQAVDDVFAKFEAAGSRARKTKQKLVARMVDLLSIHAAIEEQIFYPAVRAAAPELNDEILEGIEEHHVVKWTLSELEDLPPDAENYDAKVTVLIESVRHHVEEEEKEVFPGVRKAFTREELDDLGDTLTAAKKTAPTRPHPRTPSNPPGNVVAGAVTGILDKARDAGAAVLDR